jgi:hypothetical protein
LALGRLSTPDALQRLVNTAAPKKGLFDRRTGYRLSPVSALGEARTPEALAALRALATDKDPHVRNAAFAIARHDRPQSMTPNASGGWQDNT